MVAKVLYNENIIGTIEESNVKDLIENHFDIFKKTVRDIAGNTSGYELSKAWICRANENLCEFHVLAHGDDGLIGYDPREDLDKEIIFQITGIPESELSDTYNFEIAEEKKFNPFDKENYTDFSSVVGILEGCVDFLVKNSWTHKVPLEQSVVTIPTQDVRMSYPTLKQNNPSMYLTQLMKQFGYKNVPKTSKNQRLFDLIDELLFTLTPMLNSDTKIEGVELLLYHKTMYFFQHMDKITALKYYREKAGKTQSEIADSVGISLRQYQRYESTRSSLTEAKKAVIDKIAETIGVKSSNIVNNHMVVLISEKSEEN